MPNFLDIAIWEGKIFNGLWVPAEMRVPVREPATGASLANVGHAHATQVGIAAQASLHAQTSWRDTPAEVRARILRDAASAA